MPSTTDEDLDDQKTDTAAEDTATSDGDATEGPADAASEPGSAADGENDDAEPATPGRRRRRFLVGALAALAVAGFATSGYLGWQLWHNRQVEQAAAQAQTAAVAYAQVLTSIDSNNVDENFAQVLDGSTGEFKDMYTKSSTQLRQLLIDNEASARGWCSSRRCSRRPRTRSWCCCSSTNRCRTPACPTRVSTAAESR